MSNQAEKKAVLAHQLLPGLFFKNPSSFIKTFNTNGDEYLQYLWKNLDGYSEDFNNEEKLQVKFSNPANNNIQILLIEFEDTSKKGDCLSIGFGYRAASYSTDGIERVFTTETDINLDGVINIFEWDQAIHRKIKSIDINNKGSFISEIEKIILIEK
jgi:hypothetical protein